jgi:hypothetical protein
VLRAETAPRKVAERAATAAETVSIHWQKAETMLDAGQKENHCQHLSERQRVKEGLSETGVQC